MQKSVAMVFFLLVVLSSRAMHHSYSVVNLSALAKQEENERIRDEILRPYREDKIQSSHWFYQILELNGADLREMKKVLIKYNQVKLGNEGKYIKYPLHEAVRSGLVPVVELLVKLKADVNYPNYHGATPLHYVARIAGGYEEKEKALAIAKYLIAYGADPNASNHVHDTALCLAVDANFRPLVKLLLNSGALVSSSDKHMFNVAPLERAARSANYKMIKLLLEKGAEEINPAIEVIGGLLDHYNSKQDKQVIDDKKIVDLTQCLQLLKRHV